MADARTQRRLAAVLAADVVGYSRLIGADETGTLATLREIWAMRFNPIVGDHRGRVVKMMGDGALVEFASAVDAVECAVAIQGAMADHGASRPAGELIAFRIGVNVGDIVIDGDDILGDGVNVAARLEAQAPVSGILVSDSVHVQVKGKVNIQFSDAGELILKNIATPVRAWSWGGEARASLALPLLDNQTDATSSIAVLPFNNMSGDPEQEYFSDGISEDIITDLSKIAGLIVVARNSSFAYKGKTPDIRVVGRELGVLSVLEGSIRRAGNRVRITAQLIDANTGHHIWADRYDRELTDIFAVQDEVTLQIVSALKISLRPTELAGLARTPTRNVEAHDFFLRGREYWLALTRTAVNSREILELGIAAFKRASEIDPDYAAPLAGLSLLYVLEHQNHWLELPGALDLAVQSAMLAVKLDPTEAFGHFAVAVASLFNGDPEETRLASDRALALSPNFALVYAARGTAELCLGNSQAAIGSFERGLRLDPIYSHQMLHFLGTAYLIDGQYEAAIAKFNERIVLSPETDFSRAFGAAALGQLGREAEAQRLWQELQEINPKYSLDAHLDRLPWRNPADPARIREGLRKAGLPA